MDLHRYGPRANVLVDEYLAFKIQASHCANILNCCIEIANLFSKTTTTKVFYFSMCEKVSHEHVKHLKSARVCHPPRYENPPKKFSGMDASYACVAQLFVFVSNECGLVGLQLQ